MESGGSPSILAAQDKHRGLDEDRRLPQLAYQRVWMYDSAEDKTVFLGNDDDATEKSNNTAAILSAQRVW